MNRCKKCLIPESYPGADLNNEGICKYCLNYNNNYGNWAKHAETNQTQFNELITWAKKKHRQYDALVPFSGGKDSTYVLYLATKVYKLKVLCYNFDNGFQSDIAKRNIKEAIEKSGADLITLKPNEGVLNNLYRHFLKHTGMICPVCMRGIVGGQFAVTRLFNIPLVLQGTSKRTEENVTPEIFQDGSLPFFQGVLKDNPIDEKVGFLNFDRTILEKIYRGIFLISKQKIKLGCINVQVPEYMDWNYKEIYNTITKEFNWMKLPDRDEHVDCQIDPVVHYMRKLRIPSVTPNLLRYSSEIRAGQIKRNDALKLIEKEEKVKSAPVELKILLNKLNLTNDDFALYMQDNFRHMKYQKKSLSAAVIQKIRNSSVKH